MPLSLAQWIETVPDLEFPIALHRVGTCPACGQHGMTLKLLEWKPKDEEPILEYEALCPHGCPTLAIETACLRRLVRASLEVG